MNEKLDKTEIIAFCGICGWAVGALMTTVGGINTITELLYGGKKVTNGIMTWIKGACVGSISLAVTGAACNYLIKKEAK